MPPKSQEQSRARARGRKGLPSQALRTSWWRLGTTCRVQKKTGVFFWEREGEERLRKDKGVQVAPGGRDLGGAGGDPEAPS